MLLNTIAKRALFAVSPRHAAIERARASLDLPIFEFSPEVVPGRKARRDAYELLISRQFEALSQKLADQLATRATTPSGVRFSEMTLHGIFDPIHEFEEQPDYAARQIELFEDWLQVVDDKAAVSALLARALQIVGHCFRGGDYAGRVSDKQRRLLAEQHRRAARIQVAVPEAERGELWHRTRFQGGLTDGSDAADLLEAFESYLAFDPGNLFTYFDRAKQLLPRWHGSYEQLEVFARQSAERTSDLYGAGTYSQIYLAIEPFEGLPGNTNVDWGRMKAGLRDLLEVWPGSLVGNIVARTAARFGDMALVREMFDQHIIDIRLHEWNDLDEVYALYVRAFD